VLLNANKYPRPTVVHPQRDKVRFLYVGRLHAAKGVAVLLRALDVLAHSFEFDLNIVGGGPEEQSLRERFGDRKWCHFNGHVDEETVSNFMQQSDVLCVPSIWLENSPGVVIHALSQGLPVIGSDKGGIPELVLHDRNGLLVPAGDESAWRDALARILTTPEILDAWRSNMIEHADVFDQDMLGRKLMQFVVETSELP
jgi:glycosyltransferase involved in cell wall biosynthesis